MTVTRIRPNKIMLRAQINKDSWQAVGNPHLDCKDIQLLERTNGIKPTIKSDLERELTTASIPAIEVSGELTIERGMELEI